jgi:hypothetical protein
MNLVITQACFSPLYCRSKRTHDSWNVCSRLNEDEIAILFGANANPAAREFGQPGVAAAKKKGILDAKKAQNIAIQLRALNIATQDICDALLQGIQLL